ncbi:MAG: hypothetical protein WBX78_21905 [Pseudolabrys sp.]
MRIRTIVLATLALSTTVLVKRLPVRCPTIPIPGAPSMAGE